MENGIHLIYEESEEHYRKRVRRQSKDLIPIKWLSIPLLFAVFIGIIAVSFPMNLVFACTIIIAIIGMVMFNWLVSDETPVRFKITSEGIYFPFVTRSRRNAYLPFSDIKGIMEQPDKNLIFFPERTRGVFRLDDSIIGIDAWDILIGILNEKKVKIL